MRSHLLLLLLALTSLSTEASPSRKPSSSSSSSAQPKLNYDLLPSLTSVLEALDMQEHLLAFVRGGITETRYLLKLSRMDFQLMELDWGLSKQEISLLRDRISELLVEATVEELPFMERNKERDALRYGRIYIPNAVQSFEFLLASFGGHTPVGPVHLCLADSEDGCLAPLPDTSYEGCLYIIRRGNCSFLQKAHIALSANTSGLIIVNDEDRLEALSSGLGVLPYITESHVANLSALPVLCVANTSWAKLLFTLTHAPGGRALAYTVPLKCGSGGRCDAVTAEERALATEVAWGGITIRTNSDVPLVADFMASTFGGVLPLDSLCVIASDPPQACEYISPLTSAQLSSERCPAGVALVARRGSCHFDVKALHAQKAGARVLVIVDAEHTALQRLGGQEPLMGAVGMPSILITPTSGERLLDLMSAGEDVFITLTPSSNSLVADIWTQLAYTVWATDADSLVVQVNNLINKYAPSLAEYAGESEILKWLERKKHLVQLPLDYESDEL